MAFTYMSAGLASPDASISQLYRRGVLIHCPPEYTVDIVPPIKEGSSWHYALRVKPLASPGSPPPNANGKPIRGYEIHRKWEDCLDLQRIVEKEHAFAAKTRRNNIEKKEHSLYSQPQQAASFASLPTGPDPKSIPTDIHAFLPKLVAKSSLFRGPSGSTLVQRRSEEFNEFIRALFAPGTPLLLHHVRQSQAVREWFGFWRRDRDAKRKRDGNRAGSVLSGSTSSRSLPSPGPIPERRSHETTLEDLGSTLDTFPMPPTAGDSPWTRVEHTVGRSSLGDAGPLVRRRLNSISHPGAVVPKNAERFDLRVVPQSEGDEEEDRFGTVRGPQAEDEQQSIRSGHTPSLFTSSGSSQLTTLSTPPRSSRASEWSVNTNCGVSHTLMEAEAQTEGRQALDGQNETERAPRSSLSSFSSTSSRRIPPPIPPRSSLRRPIPSSVLHGHVPQHGRSDVEPAIARIGVPKVVNEKVPDFEAVTHAVLRTYLDDQRSSLASFGFGAPDVRNSMTPSLASVYSTAGPTSNVPQPPNTSLKHLSRSTQSSRSSGVSPPLSPVPANPHSAPSADDLLLKAVCSVDNNIILCRVARNIPLESVRSLLANKFARATGVEIDLMARGFMLGYVPEAGRRLSGRPGTIAATPVISRFLGRPDTAPSDRRARTPSISSMTASADTRHLTMIVTQRDWEDAVAKHREKMVVKVLLS